MKQMQNDTALEEIRNALRQERLCAPEQLHQLLFSIRLKEYCIFLKRLSAQDTEFRECFQHLYQELTYYYYQIQPAKLRRFEALNECSEEELTVGRMLQKAADMITNYEDYAFKGVHYIGRYITDMLVVRPFALLNKNQN